MTVSTSGAWFATNFSPCVTVAVEYTVVTEDHPNMEERLRRMTAPLRTVALLCREPGLLVLDALMSCPKVKPVLVLTHRTLPKAEGGGVRPELAEYERMCKGRVPLMEIDPPSAKSFAVPPGADLLISLSWRAVVDERCLSKFRHTINIHRGELPRYAGAEPVRRALEAGEKRVAITAHRMVAEVDAGPEIARVWHDVGGETDPERVKRNMYPLYAPLALAAIEAVTCARMQPEPPRVLVDKDPTWDGNGVVD